MFGHSIPQCVARDFEQPAGFRHVASGFLQRLLEHRFFDFLEQHIVEPLGGVRSVAVDIRVIAATNQELPDLIKAGRFRLDLYYRLNVYQLRMPPLREE